MNAPSSSSTLALLGLLAVVSVAFAVTSAAGSAGAEKPVIDLAHERFESARIAFDRRVDECIQLQRRVADPSPFRGLGLAPRQAEVAAFVLSQRAVDVCEQDAKGRLLIALGSYRAIAQRYKKQVDPQVNYYESLTFDQHWKLLEKEIEYAALSEDQRAQLERLPELKQPFDFVDLLERLRAVR